MMNYGGQILFNESRGIKEWGMVSRRLLEHIPVAEWIGKVISGGEIMMAELKLDDSQD
jgi:hypothetical protein